MTSGSTILHVKTYANELMPKCCGGWDYSTETHCNIFWWSTWHKEFIM